MVEDLRNKYSLYLISETKNPSCKKIGKEMNISHYKVNRFLEKENLNGYSLFSEVKEHLTLEGGVLSIDDTVEDKIYSKEGKSDLVSKFYSGKHHRVVLGINIITLFYTDRNGIKLPVNYRVVDKKEGKSKNEYFLEMLMEVLNWGLKPSIVTGDSWYSSEKNLKILMKQGLSFLFGLKQNRLVSKTPGEYQKLNETEINNDGEILHLRNVGFVKVFKDDGRFYAYYDSKAKNKRDNSFLLKITRIDFEIVHKKHWNIEEYHRALKQVCNIEKHLFRNKNTIINHIHFSLRGFCILEINRFKGFFKNWYSYSLDLSRKFIKDALNSFKINNLVFVKI